MPIMLKTCFNISIVRITRMQHTTAVKSECRLNTRKYKFPQRTAYVGVDSLPVVSPTSVIFHCRMFKNSNIRIS